MTPAMVATLLLALAVLLSGARLAWRVRGGFIAAGPAALRFVGQGLVAGLLWFALFPPPVTVPATTLVVLTPGADTLPAPAPGEIRVALPGAGIGADAEPVPDLGTALRRHPRAAALRIRGHGLPARDHDAATGLPLVFEPAPLPDGLHAIQAPATAMQGRSFTVRGRVQGLADGRVELQGPAGKTLASAQPDESGDFVLEGRAGLAGPTPFRLRWLDAQDSVVGTEALQLEVMAPARPRLLVLAGGPGPELKYLRRWAVDAGLELHTVIDVGGGVQLGDRPLPVNAATLSDFDLVVLDERSWRQLGAAARGQLRESVRDGLGVLLRITGPLPDSELASLREWGLVLEDSDAVRSLRWPETPVGGTSVPKGIGTEAPPTSAAAAANPAPQLSRRPLKLSARDGRPLHLAPDGEALVVWRNEGRGRIGATILSDSYRLWLSGRQSAFGQHWADSVQTLARARGEDGAPAPAPAWQGERTMLCGLSDGDHVAGPDGSEVTLAIDPASGASACAGYWPAQPGLHQLRRGGSRLPLLVRDPDAYPAMIAYERQAATKALAAQAPVVEPAQHDQPAPRWPWWLAWLLASAGLWLYERRAKPL
ncbi:carboxypeptidase regulatory-like domain-containing protein [Arenimonas sp.]|uniref:carboxypeptidase regulatory-like domain-containing protein n=1 Tax=Arenimonas sp. TaxID=1872635 RepID=UPI0035B40F74